MSYALARGLRAYSEHILQLAEWRAATLLRGRQLSPKRFILFGRGRSGTTTLVSLLNSHPQIVCEGEILALPVFFPHQHVLARCANSGAAVYGCKILSYQVSQVQSIKSRQAFIHDLYQQGFQIIYLKRRNLLQHALSNIRARQFGFHSKTSAPGAGSAGTPSSIAVDPDELLRWMQGSAHLERFEDEALQGVPHLPLVYEDHLADASSHEATAAIVFDFLGLDHVPVSTEYRKVSPESLRDSVANYDELVQALQGTPYAPYLSEP